MTAFSLRIVERTNWVNLIPQEVDHSLRQRLGDPFAKLDKTAVQAVVTAQVEGSATNARMQEITGELQTLVRDGLLTQQNQRRWASYRVAGDSPQLDENSRHLVGDSPHLSPELPSLTESARRIRYSRIANPSFD